MRRSVVFVACLAVLVCTHRAGAEDEAVRPQRIQVFGPDGRPFPNAQIVVTTDKVRDRAVFAADLEALATTPADGRAEDVGDGTPQPGRLVVWSPGHAAVLVPAHPYRATVRLSLAEVITGRIRYARGEPAARVEVLAVPVDEHADLVHRTRTSASGTYRFDSLHAGRWELLLKRAKGRYQSLGEVDAGTPAPDVELPTGASISGRLLDADRGGDAGVSRLALRFQSLPGAPDVMREVACDETGRFVASDLPLGIYQIALLSAEWEFDPAPPRIELNLRKPIRIPPWFAYRRYDVRGVVENADKKPLAGVDVRLVRDATSDDPDGEQAAVVRAVKTDASGRYRLRGVSPGEGYRVLASAGGYAPASSEPFEAVRRRDTVVAPIRMNPGWELVVRARDSGGRPVSGVHVHALPTRYAASSGHKGWATLRRTELTDTNGVASMRDLPEEDVTCIVRGDGWIELTRTFSAPAAATHKRWDVTLTPALTVTGQVLTADGKRGTTFDVAARPRDGRGVVRAQTDEDGRFELTSLRSVAIDIEVAPTSRPDVVVARRDSVMPGDETHVEIVLPTLLAVEGTVTGIDPDGGAVRVEVETPRYDPRLERHRWVSVLAVDTKPGGSTDAAFVIEGLPPGPYGLRAVQGLRDSSALSLLIHDEDVREIELPIPVGARIAGTVLDAADLPVLGAKVRLVRVNGAGDMPAGASTNRHVRSTDADGGFIFEDVAPGVWRVYATDDGFAEDMQEVRVVENEFLVTPELVLGRGGTVNGKAVLPDGRPMDGARVTLRRLEESAVARETRTRADGTFELLHVRPGACVVALETWRSMGNRPEALIEVIEDETATVDFAVKGRGTVEGTVQRRGKRVADALLELISDGVEVDGPMRRMQTRSDASGAFRWDDLLPGSYHVYLGDGSTRIHHDVYVGDGDRVVLDLEAWEAQIVGRVETSFGDAVAGAEVLARSLDEEGLPSDDAVVARGRSDPGGRFRLTGLPAGWYALDVSAPGLPPGVLESVQAEVGAAAQEVTVVLGRGGEIDLAVIDEVGRGVSGARVWIEDDYGVPLHVNAYSTGPRGKLLIPGVPSQDVFVRVEARGYGRPTLRRVRVSEGGTFPLEIALGRAGALRLYVTGAGRDPVTRARIDILRAGTEEVVARRRPLARLTLNPRWGFLPKTGVLDVGELEPDTYEVVIDAGDTYNVERVLISIDAGATTEADVALRPRPR